MLSLLTRWYHPQPTFQAITEAWLVDVERRCRDSYVREARRLLSRDLATLASRRVDRLTRREVAAVLASIPSAGVSNYAHAIISAALNWSIASGLFEGPNPAHGLRKRQIAPRTRVLSVPELAIIWRAADGLGKFGNLTRLLIATGLRRAEAGGLLWNEVSPAFSHLIGASGRRLSEGSSATKTSVRAGDNPDADTV